MASSTADGCAVSRSQHCRASCSMDTAVSAKATAISGGGWLAGGPTYMTVPTFRCRSTEGLMGCLNRRRRQFMPAPHAKCFDLCKLIARACASVELVILAPTFLVQLIAQTAVCTMQLIAQAGGGASSLTAFARPWRDPFRSPSTFPSSGRTHSRAPFDPVFGTQLRTLQARQRECKDTSLAMWRR
jgi:hypothetical protein